MPRGRLRTLLNALLLGIERRGARTYEIGELRVRFAVDAAPSELGPSASAQDQLGALQLETFARAVETGHVVADVGAYRGEYTVVAALRAGRSGRVAAFEPTAENIPYIERNCRLNGVHELVEIVPLAAGDRAGTVTFFLAGASSTNSMIAGATQGDHPQQRIVGVTTLDAFFAESKLPDVVKIDVEGAEWRVLRGAERIVRSNATIFVELHPYAWEAAADDAEAMRAWLKERGRTLVDVATGAEIREWRYGAVRLQRVE